MTQAEQIAILDKLHLHLSILRQYEQGELTEEDLSSVILICNSANTIINELQAALDTERLIERVKGRL